MKIEWTEQGKRGWRVVYKRSKMLYFVKDDKIFIADFWDVRSNH